MSQEYIRKKAREIFCQYATNDPVQIARDLDIGIKYADIGALKGLYTIVLDKPFIVVNQNLSEADLDEVQGMIDRIRRGGDGA